MKFPSEMVSLFGGPLFIFRGVKKKNIYIYIHIPSLKLTYPLKNSPSEKEAGSSPNHFSGAKRSTNSKFGIQSSSLKFTQLWGAGMPAETSQRPSGVAFSLSRTLIVCSCYYCPYQKQCNENESNVVSYILTSFRRSGSAEDIGRRWSHHKRVIRWLHALTYTLDNLDICIVCV